MKYVIPYGNSTDALQIALMALNLKRGDEVIVPTFNYIAIGEVFYLLKLVPILVDIMPDEFNINLEEVKKSYWPKNKSNCSSSFN